MPVSANLQAALQYHKKGLSVIPAAQDKKPLISWLPYQQKRATEQEIGEWWTRYPKANIGIVTGKISGITVVDCDSREADEKFRSVYKGETPTAKTPRGVHYYLKYAEGIRNTVKVSGSALDVRGDGGYVLAPPSINTEGRGYWWLKNIDSFALDSFDFNSLYIGNEVTREKLPLTSSDFFCEGRRDEDLFHIATCLVKGGAQPHIARKVLQMLALQCTPPFPSKDVETKFESALKRNDRKKGDIASIIREWVLTSSGFFLTSECFHETSLTSREDQKAGTLVFLRLCKEGVLEKHGSKRGCYRVVDQTIEFMDFENADPNDTIDLILPLGLHKKTKLFPKACIALSGVSGMGKTLFALNTIRENMGRMPCFYFNSEMSPQQLKSKLSFFPTPMTEWVKRMKVVDNWDFNNIADKIQPDALNVVDYLEPEGDKPYNIHGVISAIIRKLNRGVAFVTIQKKPDAKLGTGGVYSIKAATLALALDYGRIEIVKNRNREADPHPSLNCINFDVQHGYEIKAKSGWYAAKED